MDELWRYSQNLVKFQCALAMYFDRRAAKIEKRLSKTTRTSKTNMR